MNNDKGKQQQKGKDPRSAFSYPIKKGMDKHNPNNPGEQKHLLARLKKRYGENFINIADVYKEFSNGDQIENLIKTIFSKRFNFDEYGVYLTHPLLLSKMIERSTLRYNEAKVHFFALNNCVQLYGEAFSSTCACNPGDLYVILKRDQSLMNSWGEALNTFVQTYNENVMHPNVNNYLMIKAKVGLFYSAKNAFGTPLSRIM